jgi:hypothetical protein
MGEFAALAIRHDTALEDVNGYTAVFVLREQICAATSCGCVFATQRFEGTFRRSLKDYESDGLNPEAEGGTFLGKAGKKLSQDNGTTTHATRFVNRHPVEASNRCLHNVKMGIISDYFNLNRLLCRVYERKVGTIEVFMFGRQSS